MLVSVEGELSSYTTKATYGQIEETKTPKKTRPMSTPVPIRPTRPNRPGSLVLNDAGSSGGYIYSIGGSGSNRPGSNRNSLVGGVGSLLNGNNFNSSVNYAATGAGAASPNVSTPPSAMPAMSPNGGGMTRARSRSASSPLPADVPPSALSRPLVLHPDFRRDGDVVLVCSDMGELVGFRVNGSMLRMAR
jgi:hypothetical protein